MKKLIPEWDLSDIGPFCYEHITEKLKKPFTEDTMIDILIKQSNWFDLLQAIMALRKVGTEKSIKYLKTVVLEYNSTKKMDIQGTGVLTIAKLANGMENDFLGKLLLNENYKNKWYTMAAIFYKINDKALPYVLEYGINKIKKSKTMPEVGRLVLIYLAKYAPENEQSKKIFSKINEDFNEMNQNISECLHDKKQENNVKDKIRKPKALLLIKLILAMTLSVLLFAGCGGGLETYKFESLENDGAVQGDADIAETLFKDAVFNFKSDNTCYYRLSNSFCLFYRYM